MTDCASSDSAVRRQKRYLAIERFGFSVMPCTRCKSKRVECKMVEGGRKCQTCTLVGRPCDSNGVPLFSRWWLFLPRSFVPLTFVPVSRMVEEDERLEREEEKAEAELLQKQASLNEAISKLARLRRQRRLLKAKGGAAVVSAERDASAEEVSEAVADVQSLVHSDVVDWSSLGLEEFVGLGPLPDSEIPSV